MSECNRLSGRVSEFVSVRQLVFAIADAEQRPTTEIATALWNLLSESDSAPEWLQRHDGVTYRLEHRAQDTGWYALRALREGRDCHGGWDHRMGFSRSQIREFVESRGLSISLVGNNACNGKMPPGPERDAAMMATHARYKANGGKELARTAADFDCSKTVVTRAINRARTALAPTSESVRPVWDPFREK